MKFTHFRRAITQWQHETKQPNPIPAQAPRKRVAKPSQHSPKSMVRQEDRRVVKGVVQWRPIDRTAAIVVAKAPWWARPPPETNNTKPTMMKTVVGKQSELNDQNLKTNLAAGTIITKKEEGQMDAEVCHRFNAKAEKTLESTESLLDKTVECRASMRELCETFQADWFDFMESTTKRIAELRITRMSLEAEMRLLMGQFKDVRTFFNGPDYSTEVARMKEFVELCERMQALKKSGFLDSMADTLIKLS